MKKVLLIGQDPTVTKELTGFFAARKATLVSKNGISDNGGKFLFIDNLPYFNQSAADGIAILLSKIPNITVPRCFTAICDSNNIPALSTLLGRQNQTVTVGFKSTDTVTFASMAGKYHQISLQRGMTALSGKEIPAGDYRFEKCVKDPVAALICAAVSLLLE